MVVVATWGDHATPEKVSKFSVCASLGVLGKRVSRVENGRLSCVAFVSFCEIQSNHALPRGGGICGNAHMRKTRFAR